MVCFRLLRFQLCIADVSSVSPSSEQAEDTFSIKNV